MIELREVNRGHLHGWFFYELRHDGVLIAKWLIRLLDMAAKTNAERQAELKARRQAAGLVPVTNLWVHPGDVAAVREHAAKLARKRAKADKLTR